MCRENSAAFAFTAWMNWPQNLDPVNRDRPSLVDRLLRLIRRWGGKFGRDMCYGGDQPLVVGKAFAVVLFVTAVELLARFAEGSCKRVFRCIPRLAAVNNVALEAGDLARIAIRAQQPEPFERTLHRERAGVDAAN